MKNAQNIVGYALVGLGAACILVGVSPLFAIRFEAYFLGVVLFAAGAWVLVGRELRQTIRRGLRATGKARGAKRPAAGQAADIDPLLAVRILKLAREERGLLTVAQVAIALNVPIDQAEAGLAECVRSGNALPDIDVPRGHVLYRFPEFTPTDTPRLSH